MANHHKTILELFTIAAFNLDSVQQAVVSWVFKLISQVLCFFSCVILGNCTVDVSKKQKTQKTKNWTDWLNLPCAVLLSHPLTHTEPIMPLLYFNGHDHILPFIMNIVVLKLTTLLQHFPTVWQVNWNPLQICFKYFGIGHTLSVAEPCTHAKRIRKTLSNCRSN